MFSQVRVLQEIKTLPLERVLTAIRPDICVLGEQSLRRPCAELDLEREVRDQGSAFHQKKFSMHRALYEFRKAKGYGRSIAAPQIGESRRYLAVNLGQGFFTMINPKITWKSEETFTMWDDCLSLPDLLVKTRRHHSISFEFIDDFGESHIWQRCNRNVSELLQHEMDHLDGIVMTDRMEGPLESGLIFRSAFERDPASFKQQVDYVIS